MEREIIEYIKENVPGRNAESVYTLVLYYDKQGYSIRKISNQMMIDDKIVKNMLIKHFIEEMQTKELSGKAVIEKPPYYSKELDVFAIAEYYPHLCPKKFSALKYLLRAGQKEGVTELEDLDKLTNCIEQRKKEIRDKG